MHLQSLLHLWKPLVAGTTTFILGLVLVWFFCSSTNDKDTRKENVKKHDVMKATAKGDNTSAVERDANYDLTAWGFMPTSCVKRLNKYFDPWEEVAKNLVASNLNGTTRKSVDLMPILDCAQLRSEDEWKRASMILMKITHSYIFGECVIWDVAAAKKDPWSDGCQRAKKAKADIPPQLAIPFYQVCQEYYGMPPIMTHCPLDLWSWQLKDETKPFSIDNIELSVPLTNSPSEQYFHLCVTDMHRVGGLMVSRIRTVPISVYNKNVKDLKSSWSTFETC